MMRQVLPPPPTHTGPTHTERHLLSGAIMARLREDADEGLGVLILGRAVVLVGSGGGLLLGPLALLPAQLHGGEAVGQACGVRAQRQAAEQQAHEGELAGHRGAGEGGGAARPHAIDGSKGRQAETENKQAWFVVSMLWLPQVSGRKEVLLVTTH